MQFYEKGPRFMEGHRHIVNTSYIDPSQQPTKDDMKIGIGVAWLPIKFEARLVDDELVAWITWQVGIEELLLFRNN
jgi:hypothetical protein